jgi:hypothetical protein
MSEFDHPTLISTRLPGWRQDSRMASVAPHGQAFLAELLRHLPPGFAVEFDGSVLWAVSPDGGRAGTTADWLTADVLLDDEAVDGAVGSLNLVQQEVAEETTEPWPATSGEGYRGLPEPDGEVSDDALHLWFGPQDAPVLRLSPISLRGVLLRD